MKYIVTVLLLCTCLFSKGQDIEDLSELIMIYHADRAQAEKYLKTTGWEYAGDAYDKELKQMSATYSHKTSGSALGIIYPSAGNAMKFIKYVCDKELFYIETKAFMKGYGYSRTGGKTKGKYTENTYISINDQSLALSTITIGELTDTKLNVVRYCFTYFDLETSK